MRVVHDKSRYYPGDSVLMTIKDLPEAVTIDSVEVIVWHLHHKEDSFFPKLETASDHSQHFVWKTPTKDFMGYLLQLRVTVENNETNLYTAIDVSSDWRRFPRYGYLTDFSAEAQPAKIMDEMVNWQLNSIEYYDWKFLHHQLVPSDGSMEWEDWSGRKISGETVKSYIKEARKRHIVNMSYNMIYAATNNYQEYGISDKWGLWYAGGKGSKGRTPGERFVFRMGESPSGQDSLYFFDIGNPEWQDFIIDKNLTALDLMGFDGWHGDTVGEWGPMWTHETLGNQENTKLVKDDYKDFLDLTKTRLGTDRYLSFNPVGAQGIEQVNESSVDMLYAEIWPWDKDRDEELYDSYGALKKVVDRAREESGGKSLVIPAYMEYTKATKVEHEPFNLAAVMLTDAAVYAAGGSRIELGDGHQMLSSEYFPNRNLYMNEEHLKKQLDLQNFIVAYENLLRDGLEDDGKKLIVKDLPISKEGLPETIWAYSKENEQYETIQLINLLGVKQSDWRAADGVKETPMAQKEFVVQLYSDESFKSAWFVTPDQIQAPVFLDMAYSEDQDGRYVSVTVPKLEFWSMVYFEKEE